jgi:hypothetical protein
MFSSIEKVLRERLALWHINMSEYTMHVLNHKIVSDGLCYEIVFANQSWYEIYFPRVFLTHEGKVEYVGLELRGDPNAV